MKPQNAFYLLQQRELRGHCAAQSSNNVQEMISNQIQPQSQKQGFYSALAKRYVEVKEIQGHSQDICNIVFSNSGLYFFTGSDDALIKMWRTESLLLRHTFKGHQNAINYLSISSNDHYLASAGNDATIRIWNCQTGIQEKIIYVDQEALYVGFVPHTLRLIFTCNNCLLKMIELWPEEKTYLQLETTTPISRVAIHSLGTYFAAGDNSGHVYIYDMEQCKTYVKSFHNY